MQRFFNAALDVYKYFFTIYWKNMHDDDWHTKTQLYLSMYKENEGEYMNICNENENT